MGSALSECNTFAAKILIAASGVWMLLRVFLAMVTAVSTLVMVSLSAGFHPRRKSVVFKKRQVLMLAR